MKMVDANVLLYAVNSAAPHHRASRAWLDEAVDGREVVGLPWVVMLAFLRLSTHPRVFPRPLPVDVALGTLEGWRGRRAVVTPEPTPRHGTLLASLLREGGTGGNLVTDAHIAALAIEHRATVVTWDRDFARFDGVSSEVPTARQPQGG